MQGIELVVDGQLVLTGCRWRTREDDLSREREGVG